MQLVQEFADLKHEREYLKINSKEKSIKIQLQSSLGVLWTSQESQSKTDIQNLQLERCARD